MLQNETAFYGAIRASKLFGPVFDSKEFQGVQEIIKDCAKARWPIAFTAYALATAYHETAHTMQPIKEYGGNAYFTRLYDISGQNPKRAKQMGNTRVGDGAKYCGRGYVQLTWKVNYEKATKELKVDFVNNPDWAMNPDYASDIMVRGMEQGWFTGKKLKDYLPHGRAANAAEFKRARRIINGTDKDAIIADYALRFQSALQAGDWR